MTELTKPNSFVLRWYTENVTTRLLQLFVCFYQAFYVLFS